MIRSFIAGLVLFVCGLLCLDLPARAWWQSIQQVAISGGTVAVTRDVIGTQQFQSASNNFNKTPINITAGLTNSALVCMVIRGSAALDTTTGIAATWNGTSLALRKSQTNSTDTTRAVFLFGLRNPTSGSQTLNISATNIAADNFVNCVSFSNVNQTSDALAFPNPTGSFSISSIAVTSAAGHIAVGVFAFGGTGGTIIGTTVINDQSSGAILSVGADYVISTTSSTTVGTTVTQNALAGMDVSN